MTRTIRPLTARRNAKKVGAAPTAEQAMHAAACERAKQAAAIRATVERPPGEQPGAHCAWCTDRIPGHPGSHGICPACLAREMGELALCARKNEARNE